MKSMASLWPAVPRPDGVPLRYILNPQASAEKQDDATSHERQTSSTTRTLQLPIEDCAEGDRDTMQAIEHAALVDPVNEAQAYAAEYVEIPNLRILATQRLHPSLARVIGEGWYPAATPPAAIPGQPGPFPSGPAALTYEPGGLPGPPFVLVPFTGTPRGQDFRPHSHTHGIDAAFELAERYVRERNVSSAEGVSILCVHRATETEARLRLRRLRMMLPEDPRPQATGSQEEQLREGSSREGEGKGKEME